MTSLPRKRRKFVGRTNGLLNDFVKHLNLKERFAMWICSYFCVLFIKDLQCRFMYAMYLFIYLTISVDYVHRSALSSLINIRAVWIVSNSWMWWGNLLSLVWGLLNSIIVNHWFLIIHYSYHTLRGNHVSQPSRVAVCGLLRALSTTPFNG